MGSCLLVGSAHGKNTEAKAEGAGGTISDTLRAYANGRKDDWNSHLTLAEFAINNTASTLGDDLTPFFIDSGTHRRLSLCDISRFSPRIDLIFPGEALYPFLGAQDEGFSEFRSR